MTALEAPPVPSAPPLRRRQTFRATLREASNWQALRTTKYGLLPLVALTAVDFVQAFDNAIYSLVIVEIRNEFQVSLTTIGVAASIVGTLALLSTPLVGYLSDRVSRVRLVALSALFSGVFSMLTAGGRSITELAAIRSLDEIGENVGNVPTGSLMADYYPIEVRGKAYAARGLALKLGGLLAPLTVGALATWLGWRAPFLVTAPLIAVSAVFVLLRLREPVRGYWERLRMGADEELAAEPEPPMGFIEALRTAMAVRTLRRVLIASSISGLAATWFGFLYNFYLSEQFGFDAFQRALLLLPGGVGALAGIFIGGGIVDSLIRRRPQRVLTMLGLLSLLAALTPLVLVAVPSLTVLIITSTIFGATSGILAPASQTVFSLIIPPRLRGLGMGILLLSALPTAVLGASVAGKLGDTYGVRGGMVACVPLLALGALVYVSSAGFFESDMRSAIASAAATQEARRARDAGETKLLVCRGVDVHYGNVQVLFGVDFDLAAGEIVALLGTNGAGKSTLLRAISGVAEASSGGIVFDGREITHAPPYEISRLGVIHMPGGRGVFAGLSVRENLDLALWSADDSEKADLLETVFGYFPVLRTRLEAEAGLLSGGEQQMVALAQAFLAKPRLLLIDELSLGLSPAVVGQLLEIVREIHARGTTIVLVEQSVNVALTVAERAVFMEKGQVRFSGATRDLLAQPDIMRAVYLKGAGALSGGPVQAVRLATAEHGRPILQVEGLTKHYGGVVAVDGVSLVLHEGEALGLIGPNGAGKTTVFDLISGYQRADAGAVLFDGVDITKESPDARARRGLLRRFQDARLFPSLTVQEAICLSLEQSLEVRSMFVTALQLPAVRRGERRVAQRASRLIDLLELGDCRHSFISELSTGLRRVVDLACVLAAEPRVLLLDEPSSGIAQAEAESFGPLLRRVRRETGASLLVIEHDVPLITAVTDELVALVQGRVIARGAADEVLSHPTVVEAYLGTQEATLHRQGVLPR